MPLEKIETEEIRTEILIIGSEAAGAKAAIEAQELDADVLVVTKGIVGTTGDTVMAGPGVQAPIGHMDPRDNPDVFFEDVVKGGDYLNNQKLVERLVNVAVTEVPKMEKWGAKFIKKGDKFIQLQLPGSTYPRSLAAAGSHGGLQWRAAFKNQFKRLNTKIKEDTFVLSLLMSNGEVAGAIGISLRDGRFVIFRSKITILATGGCLQIYRKTDSSIDITGDGMMMAYNAGAELMDMEFQQFFPYCCYTPPFEMSQMTGHLRYNLRAILYNSVGEQFMERYLPMAKDWGLRDPTSRATYLENMYGRGSPHGGAYLSLSHLPENLIDDFIKQDKPPWIRRLKEAGIDIRRQALEVGPGAHYSIGGVRINENCETILPRLYAAGEVAAGMDGAERIDGGPAITWCLTSGYVAGKEAANKVKALGWLDIDQKQVNKELDRINSLSGRRKGIKGFEIKNKIKDIMWERCALVRDQKGLEEALSVINQIKNDEVPQLCVPGSSRIFNKGLVEALEAINMTELSDMVVKAALMRRESRKSHYRTDFPKHDNRNWLKNTIIKRNGDDMALTTATPIITKIKPPEE